MASSGPKLEALQILRALAAAAVMCFHGAGIFAEYTGHAWLGRFFRPGHHGVDLFFVLSGFIITFTAAGVRGPREFATKRFIRLVPVYWLVTSGLLAAYALAPRAAVVPDGDPWFVLHSLLLWPAPRYVVEVAWTLVYELWFYLLFAVLFFRSRPLFYAALSGWFALACATSLLGWRPESLALAWFLHPIVGEFLLGCVAAVLFARFGGSASGVALGVGAVGLAAAWAAEVAGVVVWRVAAFGLPSALLIYGAASLRWRWPRWTLALGDASYSLYLIHLTAISFFVVLAAKTGWLSVLAGAPAQLAVYVATLTGAALFHRVIEAPLLAACRRRWVERRADPDPHVLLQTPVGLARQ